MWPLSVSSRRTTTSAIFRLNVVADEIQFNVQLDAQRTLCLSLGSKRRFSIEQVTLLELLRPWVTALMRQRMTFERELLERPPNLRRTGKAAWRTGSSRWSRR